MNGIFSFDRAVFDELGAELGPADRAEVLNVFLADTADRLARLETGHLTCSASKREVHSIKSSAATFGFMDLSRLAIEIESGVETMAPATLEERVCGLRRVFESTKKFALENLINSDRGAMT